MNATRSSATIQGDGSLNTSSAYNVEVSTDDLVTASTRQEWIRQSEFYRKTYESSKLYIERYLTLQYQSRFLKPAKAFNLVQSPLAKQSVAQKTKSTLSGMITKRNKTKANSLDVSRAPRGMRLGRKNKPKKMLKICESLEQPASEENELKANNMTEADDNMESDLSIKTCDQINHDNLPHILEQLQI